MSCRNKMDKKNKKGQKGVKGEGETFKKAKENKSAPKGKEKQSSPAQHRLSAYEEYTAKYPQEQKVRLSALNILLLCASQSQLNAPFERSCKKLVGGSIHLGMLSNAASQLLPLIRHFCLRTAQYSSYQPFLLTDMLVQNPLAELHHRPAKSASPSGSPKGGIMDADEFRLLKQKQQKDKYKQLL